jgi:hypothetical protein
VSCSSFVATIPSTGRWWINAALRHQSTSPSDSDDEYQMRVYLGDDVGSLIAVDVRTAPEELPERSPGPWPGAGG